MENDTALGTINSDVQIESQNTGRGGEFDFQRHRSLWQVFQEIVAGTAGGCDDER